MREIKFRLGIQVEGYNINNLRCADDTTPIAENVADLQQMLDVVVIESAKRKGLSLYQEKRNNDYINEKQLYKKCDIKI